MPAKAGKRKLAEEDFLTLRRDEAEVAQQHSKCRHASDDGWSDVSIDTERLMIHMSTRPDAALIRANTYTQWTDLIKRIVRKILSGRSL